jgi:peptidylprolyl isomerase
MTRATAGNTVRVHYTGRLQDERVFDSSQGRDPLEFTLGEGKVIPGFEQAVTGMQPGEEKTVTIPAEQAYGPRREEMTAEVSRSRIPPHIEPQVGQQLQMNQEGRAIMVTVTEVTGESVTLDANHPLAGQDLTFDLELIEIAEA